MKKLIWFQLGNFVVSCGVLVFFPLTLFGLSLIYLLFSAKVLALIYFNDYPEKKDGFSTMFFALACTEVILLFWTGSFSIYTFAFSKL